MPSLWRHAVTAVQQRPERYSLNDYLGWINFGGSSYPLGVNFTMPGEGSEDIPNSFEAYCEQVYKSAGPVFACVYARMRLFTQARFQWQSLAAGIEGNLFGSPALALLEHPWPHGTTPDMLARLEQDVSLAGNVYLLRESSTRLRRLRPDWVSIILSAPPTEATRSDVIGYAYQPGGPRSTVAAELFRAELVAHWAPIPDPDAQYRGMSWVTPVLDEIQADISATRHKAKFFQNAATPNLAVSFKESVSEDKFKQFMAIIKESGGGVENAYKTLFLGGGADVKVVGADLRQMSFQDTQGAGETRIAAAAGVPPIIVGMSEGLQAATYSNYGQARRAFGDHWARPQWGSMCSAVELLVTPPGGARLWYADKHIAMLREDAKDAAEVQMTLGGLIKTLTDAGFKPDAAVDAVMAGDLSRLKGQHTGLFSVQLMPPIEAQPAALPPGPPPGPAPAAPPAAPPKLPPKPPAAKKPAAAGSGR